MDKINFHNVLTIAGGLLLLAAVLLVGRMDYADQRGMECERQRKVWDESTDRCVPQTPQAPSSPAGGKVRAE